MLGWCVLTSAGELWLTVGPEPGSSTPAPSLASTATLHSASRELHRWSPPRGHRGYSGYKAAGLTLNLNVDLMPPGLLETWKKSFPSKHSRKYNIGCLFLNKSWARARMLGLWGGYQTCDASLWIRGQSCNQGSGQKSTRSHNQSIYNSTQDIFLASQICSMQL